MDIREQLPALDRLSSAWRWWLDEISALLPEALKKHFSPDSGLLRVRETAEGYSFELTRGGQHTDLGSIDLVNATDEQRRSLTERVGTAQALPPRVELILAEDRLLSHEVFLPLAVEGNLASVLLFEVDKLTPFRKGEAMLAFRQTGRHPELNKVSVELYCTDRKKLNAPLEKLRAMGLAPSAVLPESLLAHAGSDSINLLPAEERTRPESMWNSTARRQALVAAGLTVMALIIPAWYLERKVEHLQLEIDEVRVQATRVAEKRGQVMGHLMARQALVQQKNQQPGQLEVIAELTRLIPDNTWVSRLRVFGNKVLIQGESGRASDLIEVLEQSGLFSNVRFRSPITRNPRTALEQYQIELETGAAS